MQDAGELAKRIQRLCAIVSAINPVWSPAPVAYYERPNDARLNVGCGEARTASVAIDALRKLSSILHYLEQGMGLYVDGENHE